MAAITAGVIAGGTALYGANRQASAAKDAARAQARGVQGAREDTEAATNRARAALTGGYYPELYQPFYQQAPQMGSQVAPQEGGGLLARVARAAQEGQPAGGSGAVGGLMRQIQGQEGVSSPSFGGGAVGNLMRQVQGQGVMGPTSSGDRPMGAPQMGPQQAPDPTGLASPAFRSGARGLSRGLSSVTSGGVIGGPQQATLDPATMQQIPGFTPPQINDPRADFMQGVQSNLQFTNQGYGQAESTLSPLAQMAQPYLNEQYNLLGMGGDDAYQQAISRVADPMRAEQERALTRNNAALGGVGGNVLAQLAEATRARTEANIGNRLGQLSAASSPSLSALQNISNLQLNRNLRMGDTMQGAGAGLADMETNRRQALANIELGQGSQMAQLSQNLGTAQAGGAAYAAQNQPALSQGIMSGLSAYMGAGGSFGGGDPYGTRASGYSFSGDPFA